MTDRSTFTENAIEKLEKINAEIERAEAEADTRRAAGAEIRRRERMALLRQKQAAAEECLRQMQYASEASWEASKAEFEKRMEDLTTTLEEIRTGN